jgi:hypothetical protein
MGSASPTPPDCNSMDMAELHTHRRADKPVLLADDGLGIPDLIRLETRVACLSARHRYS